MSGHGGAAAGAGTISVVVPSYNHGRFLRATLASALEQSLPADELVVVDDGSDDDSPDILHSLDDPRLRVLLQENRGAHAAINRAIEESRGDWVAILNSDDLFEEERLEHAWGVARGTGALLVCGEVTLIGDDGGAPPAGHDIVRWYEEARTVGRSATSLAAALRKHNVAVTTSNFFVHRALWARLGGFRPWRYVHDYDFILRAVALCPGRVVYEPSLCDVRYRVHGANTISESHERALAERASMLRTVRGPVARLRSAAARMSHSSALARAAGSVGVPDPVRGPAGPAASGTEAPRVGIVVPSLGVGGLEEVVALLARALPSTGLGVAVHCLDSAGGVADRLRAAGISLTVGDGSAAACATWAEAAGIAAVSGHHLPVEVTAGLAARGLPVIETFHNTFAWYGEDEWAKERERWASLAGAVAVSDTVASYYEKHTGRRPDRVVPNAVHPGRVTAVPRPFARRALGLPEAGPVFVTVGRLARQKNLPGLLAAFARVHRSRPDARLLLAGPGDASLPFSTLRREQAGLFSSGAVRRLGRRDDVGTLLGAADAFVSASFYEGWSVAASEAAWVGVPMILSDVGGARELVGRGDGLGRGPRGYVTVHPCGDPLGVDEDAIRAQTAEAREAHGMELAEAMESVAADAGSWRARGPEIRAWARRTLAPTVMAGRYAELLRGVVGTPL